MRYLCHIEREYIVEGGSLSRTARATSSASGGEMLSLDDESCIECGICSDLLPQYFEVAEGRVRVREGLGPAGLEAGAEGLAEAMRDCPSGAIRS
jgi:ferredoxin